MTLAPHSSLFHSLDNLHNTLSKVLPFIHLHKAFAVFSIPTVIHSTDPLKQGSSVLEGKNLHLSKLPHMLYFFGQIKYISKWYALCDHALPWPLGGSARSLGMCKTSLAPPLSQRKQCQFLKIFGKLSNLGMHTCAQAFMGTGTEQLES